jgi:hypothetical protein
MERAELPTVLFNSVYNSIINATFFRQSFDCLFCSFRSMQIQENRKLTFLTELHKLPITKCNKKLQIYEVLGRLHGT